MKVLFIDVTSTQLVNSQQNQIEIPSKSGTRAIRIRKIAKSRKQQRIKSIGREAPGRALAPAF